MPDPGLTLLLVDSDPDAAARLGSALRASGHVLHVRTAPDADAAADYLAGAGPYADRRLHPLPGLILLDLHLQGRSALDFLDGRRMRADLRKIPVVAMAASGDDPALLSAYEKGANSGLVKPGPTDDPQPQMTRLAEYWGRLNLPPP